MVEGEARAFLLKLESHITHTEKIGITEQQASANKHELDVHEQQTALICNKKNPNRSSVPRKGNVKLRLRYGLFALAIQSVALSPGYVEHHASPASSPSRSRRDKYTAHSGPCHTSA